MKTGTFFLAIFIAGTSQAQTFDSTPQYIFPATESVLTIAAKKAVRYTPAVQDVQFADSLLIIYMQSLPITKQRSIVYSTYYRQYVGYTLGGVKQIQVYGSCTTGEYFKKTVNHFRGGGTCYLKATVNLGVGKVEHFGFNASK